MLPNWTDDILKLKLLFVSLCFLFSLSINIQDEHYSVKQTKMIWKRSFFPVHAKMDGHSAFSQFTKQPLKWEWIIIDSRSLLVKQEALEEHQMTIMWLRHRYCNCVFMHMDVPERCHWLTAVIGEKQHDVDTQTRVSFSLHIWRIWTEKIKARLFHRRGRWENARVEQQIYTYCTLFSARVGSVKRTRHLLWIGNKPQPAEMISQGFSMSLDEGVQINYEVIFFCCCCCFFNHCSQCFVW